MYAHALTTGQRFSKLLKNKLQVWVARHMWWLLPLSILIDLLFIEA